MLDLGNLTKTREQRELKEHVSRANTVAKEMFLELIGKQLNFQEAMGVINIMQETLANWGRQWLDNQYTTHLKNFLEEEGKLK